ncbi:MAG: hypothetical protein ACLTON_02625 [Christensenellales bacterium]|jgi:hypothetical protein|nr:unknown [Clostridium sp. CAG:465]
MKKGLSLSTVVIAISIMLILVSSVSVIGSSAITSANFEEYKSNIDRVSDEVNIYVTDNGTLPVTNEVIAINSLGQDFLNQVKENGDLANKFYLVDISKLNDYNIKKGRGNVENKDVFLVTENTNNVYYLKGFKYRGKVYFNN